MLSLSATDVTKRRATRVAGYVAISMAVQSCTLPAYRVRNPRTNEQLSHPRRKASCLPRAGSTLDTALCVRRSRMVHTNLKDRGGCRDTARCYSIGGRDTMTECGASFVKQPFPLMTDQTIGGKGFSLTACSQNEYIGGLREACVCVCRVFLKNRHRRGRTWLLVSRTVGKTSCISRWNRISYSALQRE